MNWRVLDKSETELLQQIGQFEQAMPTFYRDASNSRAATAEDMLRFYAGCSWLFGLFEDYEPVGLVYFQTITPDVDEVHFEFKRGTDHSECSKMFAGIRDHRYEHGMRRCMAWTFKRNKTVQQMLRDIGFELSGLSMRYGSSHGRVLQWEQMVLDRG